MDTSVKKNGEETFDVRNADVNAFDRRPDGEIDWVGKKLVVCCPFHTEQTPSCVIEPEIKSFHCLGCGRNGPAFEVGGGGRDGDGDGNKWNYTTYRLYSVGAG